MLRGFRHPGFNFKGEYHASRETVYVIKGNMGVCADDRIYEHNSGDMILHKPIEFHSLKTLGKTKSEVLIISISISIGLYHELKNKVSSPDASAPSVS